jgi:hypothetical protein
VAARVVDEDAAHGLGRDAEEVRAVLPLHLALVDELEVRLVDEGGGLEGVVGALAPQVARGELMQFAVDEREQVLQRVAVAAAPFQEELCNVGCGRHKRSRQTHRAEFGMPRRE